MASKFEISTIFKAIDKISAPINKMQNRIQRFGQSAKRALDRVNRVAGTMGRAFRKVGGAVLKMGGALTAVGVVALQKTTAAADALAKEARRLDFPIEELQQWKFVAEQSGVSQDLLSKSLGAFTKRLGEAAGGTGPLVSGLKNINPELLKNLQASESVSQSLDLIVGAMRNAETATERAAIANAAFSRSGLKLANIADLSGSQIEKLKEEMRQNGLITKEQAEQSEAYNDAMNSLKRTMQGILQTVLLPLVPKLKVAVEQMRAFLLENKELIKIKFSQFIVGITKTVKNLWEEFRILNRQTNFIDRLLNFFDSLGELISFMSKHGKTIAMVVGGLGAMSVALNAVSVGMAAVALMGGPLTILLGLLGALALTVMANWEVLKVFFQDLWVSITQNFESAVENISRLIEKVVGAANKVIGVRDRISGAIGEKVFDVVEGTKNIFRSEEEKAAMRPGVISPTQRIARSIEESRTTNTAEVTIRDETGRSEVTQGTLGAGLKLQSSGAF